MSSYFKDVFKLEAERDFESAFSSCMVNRITANAERSVLTVYVEPDGELPRDMLLRASELIREQVLFSKEIRVSLVDTKAEREREAERREALEAAQKKPEPEKRQALPGQNGFRRSQNQWTPKQDKKSDNPDVIFGYDFTGEPIALSAVTDGMGEAVVQGRIFSPESIKTRNGKFILRFNLTDDTDSIACRMFLDENEFSEVEDKMKAGTWVVLNGSVMPPDNFNPDITFGKIRGVRKGKDRRGQRMDQYDGRRRIELSLHTKMSDMDGLGDFSEYAKLAAKWGWSGLAVTDSDSVQQFPTAAHTMEKYPEMKLLFGIQATLVDDAKNAVLKSRGQSLDGEFVVFDIETTGFSQTKCRIIEIGAVKVREGQITERFSQFIDPEMPIPPHITKLTTITDAEVRGQGNYEKWIPEFVKFCGDAPVVGHNAQFDVGFIRHYAALCGIEFDPTVVDTLGLSHLLLKQLFRNRLDNVAKELHVVLSTHHRAVYDAEATAGIFLSFCEMLKNKGITDLDALYEADVMDETTVKKLHGSHFDILVKNDFGRTNLYRLVSAAHIDYFHETPRMPKSVAAKLRDGLLFGSGDEKSDLYDALIRGLDDREVEEIASFFDYLEVIPPSNLEYLLDDESASLDTIDDIRAMNRRIIEIGEKLGKPVVAVGNVHFAEPQDAVFRKVLKYFEYANKGRASRFSEKEFMSPLYLKTTEEMLAEFPDLDEETRRKIVIDNTLLLADMCERISPVRPDKCPPVIENSDKELRDICYNKAHEMYGPDLPDEVSVRLEKELTSIISNGYSVMYIIAQRLVWDSNDHGFLVGSRGSVGSSLVATMAGISEVNPLPPHYRCEKCHYVDFHSDTVKEYQERSGCDMPDRVCPVCGEPLIKDGFDIPFETFLGFKGDKEPDIDLNFAGEYQAKAHAYTEVLFGKGQTYKAGTIGTVQEKTAYGYVLRYNEDHEIHGMRRAEMERLALGMTEVRRTTGQHPGGIVVLPHGEEMNTFTPIQHPANVMTNPITTHFDYHSIDHNLLKLDILGHDAPSMIRALEDLTGVNSMTIPVGTEEVMELFKSTKSLGITPEDIGGTPLGTMGVPEFGTDFAMQMLLEAKPLYVSDLVRIAGLAHGTDVWLGNAQKLISEGTCTIQTAICTRDDIMIYLISMGVEPSDAFKIMELVRKGKFPKNPKHDEYCDEMREHGVPEWYIWSCDTIKYMFPKAHAAAYVVMSLRIAWYKIHYPTAYYAAYYTIKADGFNYETMCVNLPTLRENLAKLREKLDSSRDATANDKLALRDMRIVEEMLVRGIEFAPIDLMKAKAKQFTVLPDGRIMPSFNSIAGLGTTAAESIEADVANGPYLSLDEFIQRTKVTKTNADLMKRLGILSGLPETNQLSLFDL